MLQTLQDLDVKDKIILLRLDFNVPLIDGSLKDASRIERTVETVNYLLKQKAKVVIMSHLGRPKGCHDPRLSFQKLTNEIEMILQHKIIFLPSFNIEQNKSEIKKSQFPSLFLMENTRFLIGEEENDPVLSKNLASLGDIFCNDAFSASHRAHASTEGISKFLPSCAGFLIQEELLALSQSLENPTKPIMAIVGGSKVSTKLKILNNLITKVDFLVIGGAMANTFLLANGYEVGKSLVEKDMIEIAADVMKFANLKNCKLILPLDIVCANSLQKNVSTSFHDSDKCPHDMMILDVGKKSQEYIKNALDQSRTLIWNGPLGAFEFEPFEKSTINIAKYAGKKTKSKDLISIAGGGDTVSALKMALIENEFSYVSTAGGAFLEWLEGRKLPGIESLRKK